MDFLTLLRTFAALAVTLGLLVGALWVVRRYDLKLPAGLIGGLGAAGDRRIQLVERLPLDTRRSVALIRRDDIEHLVLIGPEGAVVIESGIQPHQSTPPKSTVETDA